MQPIEDKIRHDRTGPAGAHPQNGIRGKSHVVGERPTQPPFTPPGPACQRHRRPTVAARQNVQQISHVITGWANEPCRSDQSSEPRALPASDRKRARTGASRYPVPVSTRQDTGCVPAVLYIYRRATPPALQRPTSSQSRRTETDERPEPENALPCASWGFLCHRSGDIEQRQQQSDGVEVFVCRDELQARRGGGGGVRGVVVRLLLRRRVGRRGGPVPGHRGPPPPVRAAAGAAEADELRQHLRHVRHDGAPPRQEGAVDVLPGQVAVVRVHDGGAEPGGPAEEGEAAQDEALQELRHARRGGRQQAGGGELLRQPGGPHGRRERLQGSPEYPCQPGLLPSVVAARL